MIKRRRETLGFSQARLGELVGRSASTIRNWERDKSTPSVPSDAVALAAVLGLSENRVVEAAGFDMGDVENRPTLEQGYASLAPRGRSPDPEPVASEPAPADEPGEFEPAQPEPAEPEPAEPEPAEPEPAEPEPAQSEPAQSEPAQSEPAQSEPAQPEPAANISREAEAGDEPTSPAPSAAAGDAAAAEPDDAGRKETSPPVEQEPVAPGRRLQAIPTDTDSGHASSADEPSVSRAARPTVLETPPPDEPSYLEDPDERQRYRARALATAAVVVFLLIVFLWSFDRTMDALGTMWDDFTGMLEL